MKSTSNGNGHTIPAQWLERNSHKIPPRAFAIPPGEVNTVVLKTAPEGEQGIALVRRYVLSHFLARYGAVVKGLEAARNIADERLQLLRKERTLLQREKDSLPVFVPESRAILEIPQGLEGVFVTALILITIALIGFEWVNLAGFAARRETHDLALAMTLTALFAVAPLALKLRLARTSPSIARFADITVALIGLVSGLGFTCLYALSYAGPESAATNLIESITNPAASTATSGDKTWLLVFQILAGTAVGLVFANEIAKRLTPLQRLRLNHNLAVLDKLLADIDQRIEEWRQKLSHAEGGLDEWQHSIEVELAPCLAYLTAVQQHQQKQTYLRRLAETEATEAARNLAALTFPTNSVNH